MKVKIGNKVYDPNLELLVFILSDVDKKNIAAMDPRATMYCCYPADWSVEQVKRFMEADDTFKTVVLCETD